jgi:hypothetical protein
VKSLVPASMRESATIVAMLIMFHATDDSDPGRLFKLKGTPEWSPGEDARHAMR